MSGIISSPRVLSREENPKGQMTKCHETLRILPLWAIFSVTAVVQECPSFKSYFTDVLGKLQAYK